MIDWKYYPSNTKIPDSLLDLVEIFEKHEPEISSENEQALVSNDVLGVLTFSLQEVGYRVETGKSKNDKIKVPVTYKERGKVDLSFDADAYHEENRIVLEVEAGRAVANNQFLKDLFQASMMENVEYLCIAVRKTYTTGKVQKNTSYDYRVVISFFDALYISNRIKLPLKGILLIGY